MKSKKLAAFLDLFSQLAWLKDYASGSFDTQNQKLHSIVEEELNKKVQFFENEYSVRGVIDEIEKNLSKHNSPKAFVLRVTRLFKDIAPFLLIASKKEYTETEYGKALIIGQSTFYGSHVFTHNTLERYARWVKPELHYSESNIAEKYVIQCFEEFNQFFKLLDKLCLDFDLDLIKIQEEAGFIVWIREVSSLFLEGYSKKLRPLKSFPYQYPDLNSGNKAKEESEFSVPEWACIFYYAYETKLLNETQNVTKGLKEFINKHELTASEKSLRNEYYTVQKRINNSNDFPFSKLQKIIPFCKTNYKQAVAIIQNDIDLLKQEQAE